MVEKMPKPDFTNLNDKITEFVRVDQAGEFGAKRIYQGQLKAVKDKQAHKLIYSMMKQELIHLNYFSKQIEERRVRPTMLFPLWNIGGYLLGWISAFMGVKIAMLTTEAIEEVIEKHYQSQVDYLTEKIKENEVDNLDLLANIKQFRQDEIEHKHIAISGGSQNALLPKLWIALIRKICLGAIYLSKKI